MKGLELARKYYEEYGIPMLENEFPETRKYLAVGLVGSGSECLGYDDKISQDHDFEPGFCIFLRERMWWTVRRHSALSALTRSSRKSSWGLRAAR